MALAKGHIARGREGAVVDGDVPSTVRFFTLGDANYFLGAVALVNSLRLVGHREGITFLDLGLEPLQRRLLGEECELFDVAREPDDHPWLYQPFARLTEPSGICVILDSDVIVTRRLDSLIGAARRGEIAGYRDPRLAARRVPEWEQRFGLRAPLRDGRVYVNSGLLAFDAEAHGDFLDRWWQVCAALGRSGYQRSDLHVKWADQDALNALLMSEFAHAARVLDDPVPMDDPEMAAVEIVDLDRLECRLQGRPVTALHSIGAPKPWLRDARFQLRPSPFLDCLRRLLVGDGLRLVVDRRKLPLWLRSGTRAAVTRSVLLQSDKVPRPVFGWAYRIKQRFARNL